MNVIASYSIKGGVGKTATSVNLAFELARTGRRVLLVDLDPQGASSFYFRIRAPRGLKLNTFKGGRSKLLRYLRGSDYERLDVLPAKLAYRKFDVFLQRMKKSKRHLSSMVRAFRRHYDAVVLDAPSGISLLSENIFLAADVVLVPVVPTPLSQRTYDQLVEFFQRFQHSQQKLAPFFSIVQEDNELHQQIMQSMRRSSAPFLQTIIPQSIEVERMGVMREPVLTFAAQHPIADAYGRLNRELLNRLQGVEDAPPAAATIGPRPLMTIANPPHIPVWTNAVALTLPDGSRSIGLYRRETV